MIHWCFFFVLSKFANKNTKYDQENNACSLKDTCTSVNYLQTIVLIHTLLTDSICTYMYTLYKPTITFTIITELLSSNISKSAVSEHSKYERYLYLVPSFKVPTLKIEIKSFKTKYHQ